jgi:hypothetical protein
MKTALNEELIRLIVAQIEDTPQHWSQKDWVQHNCNTRFCFAGWAVFMSDLVDGSGKPTAAGRQKIREMRAQDEREGTGRAWSMGNPYVISVDLDGNEKWYYPYSDMARELLGLNKKQAEALFHHLAGSVWSDEADDYVEDFDRFKEIITRETGIKFT